MTISSFKRCWDFCRVGYDKSEEKGLICTTANAGSEKKYTQKEDFTKVHKNNFTLNRLRVLLKAEGWKEDFVWRKSW